MAFKYSQHLSTWFFALACFSYTPYAHAVGFNPKYTCNPSANDCTTFTELQTPSFPLKGTVFEPLEHDNTATLGNGLKFSGSSANLVSLPMGTATPNAIIAKDDDVFDHFYVNCLYGDPSNVGDIQQQTCQTSPQFSARWVHFLPGDPNEVHRVEADGLHLKSFCSKNHTDCLPPDGNTHVGNPAGMIRLPFRIIPGMSGRITYKKPSGTYAWAPIWMASGQQVSSGPAQSPYSGAYYNGVNSSNSLIQVTDSQHSPYEIDLDDGFAANGFAVGYSLDFATPSSGPTHSPPAAISYCKSDMGWTCAYTSTIPPIAQFALPFDGSTGFHNLVWSWEASTSMFYEWEDGVLFVSEYMPYTVQKYTDGFDNNSLVSLGMFLMICNQAVNEDAPGASSATENGGGGSEAWDIVVQDLEVWSGNVAH